MTAGRRAALDPKVAWEALRAAGGSLDAAAHVLGTTPLALLEVIRADRAARHQKAISGSRRRVDGDDGSTPQS